MIVWYEAPLTVYLLRFLALFERDRFFSLRRSMPEVLHTVGCPVRWPADGGGHAAGLPRRTIRTSHIP
jgi:hypothetical protein